MLRKASIDEREGSSPRSRRTSRRVLLIGAAAVALVLIIAVTVVVLVRSSGARQADAAAVQALDHPPATVAIGRDTLPPWPAPADAAAAVRAAGLPILSKEGTVEHIHAHLDVIVDGQPVEVPAAIGIVQAAGISPLHTHDTSGVIHVESPVKRQFSLGELFSEWGVSLSADNLGALRNTEGKTVRVYVNGTLQGGNPAAVLLNAHDEIAVVYGPPQPAGSVPSSYQFPQGL